MTEEVVWIGMDTPWGRARHATPLAPGIGSASTTRHGGLKLSEERLALLPTALRREGGWYEEDSAWTVPYMSFAADILAHAPAGERAAEKLERSRRIMRDWQPDEYAVITGEVLSAKESFVVARREFAERHQADLVGSSAVADHSEGVPLGFVLVIANVGFRVTYADPRRNLPSAVPDRYFLVPKGEYDCPRFGFIIDPERHREVERPANLYQIRKGF